MNRQEQLQQMLVGLQHDVPDVRGALLASRDGLAIATTLAAAEAGRVAAMAATVTALASRVVDTIGLGGFEETEIQGETGTFIVYDAGELAVLAVLAQRGATLGLVHLEARRVAHDVGRALNAYRDEQRPPAPMAAAPAPPPAPAAPAPVPAVPGAAAPVPVAPAHSLRPTEAPPAAAPMGTAPVADAPVPAMSPRSSEYQVATA